MFNLTSIMPIITEEGRVLKRSVWVDYDRNYNRHKTSNIPNNIFEPTQMEEEPRENLQGEQKEYKYLKKSVRVKGQFDLHFDKIKNSLVTAGITSAFTFLKYKWFQSGDVQNEPKSKEDFAKLEEELPMRKVDLKSQYKSQIRYTWIGHSTAVIQVGQDNLLIDPVFSDRCSPSQFFGPKRYRKPACSIQELGKIDMVLVSHDHYDHLDETSLNLLNKLYKPIFVAGLGSKSVFPKKCEYRELDWMDTMDIPIKSKDNIYKVSFVPVCHWSRRSAFDYNTRLWGGFVIETPYKQKIFYSGDTAYTEVFKEIGDKYGPFDLAILPIGAYLPRHLLSAQHVDPEEAAQIHLDLKSKKSVGVHWGTFPLGFEKFYQPKYDLDEAKKKLQIRDEDFITIQHGQSITIL